MKDDHEVSMAKSDLYKTAKYAQKIYMMMKDLPEDGERIHHRDGTIGVYVKDPFGNYLEYIWYAPKYEDIFLK